MASEDLEQDLARIAERTREILTKEEVKSKKAKAMLKDLLVSLAYDPERLRKELERLAGDKGEAKSD